MENSWDFSIARIIPQYWDSPKLYPRLFKNGNLVTLIDPYLNPYIMTQCQEGVYGYEQ